MPDLKMGDAISTLYIFREEIFRFPRDRRQINGYAPYQTTARDQRVLLWRQGELAFLIVTPDQSRTRPAVPAHPKSEGWTED
jgi:hypothetical protein